MNLDQLELQYSFSKANFLIFDYSWGRGYGQGGHGRERNNNCFHGGCFNHLKFKRATQTMIIKRRLHKIKVQM